MKNYEQFNNFFLPQYFLCRVRDQGPTFLKKLMGCTAVSSDNYDSLNADMEKKCPYLNPPSNLTAYNRITFGLRH